MKIFKLFICFNIFLIAQGLDDSFRNEYTKNIDKHIEINELNSNLNNFDLFEDVIDPKEYIVGPGDLFAFNMLSADGIVNLNLFVNPTGEILIPAIGNIKVSNFSLEQCIKLIKLECLKKYPNSNVHITLVSIRKFKIQVKGLNDVISYVEASSIVRVSDVFNRILYNYENNSNFNISERNIKIHRKNQIINVDLLAFRRFGNKQKNPMLMQGDVIELQLEENYVGLYGGVKLPGRYEIVHNETLDDLISLAGGFTKNADINNVEITRFINDIDKKILNINLQADLSKVFLKDEDHIVVRYKQDYKRQDLVTVVGEVKYPGIYSISHNLSTVKDIIEKCGGLSSKADLSKIKINNEFISNVNDFELNRIMMIPDSFRSDEEKSYIKARSRSPKGNLISSDIILTERIMNFRLNRNDILTIPIAVDYVEVLGGVYHPGRYPFYSSYNLDDYIELAGGLTNSSRSKKYIVKNNNGQKILFSKNINIENGDIIFIPEKIEYNRWDRFKEIIAVLGQLATLILVIQTGMQ